MHKFSFSKIFFQCDPSIFFFFSFLSFSSKKRRIFFITGVVEKEELLIPRDHKLRR